MQGNGIIEISDEKYAIHIDFSTPINYSFNEFPKKSIENKKFLR